MYDVSFFWVWLYMPGNEVLLPANFGPDILM